MIEVLVVIVILGVLATVTIFGVRAITDRGEQSSCSADQRIVNQAVEAYFAENQVSVLPATGVGNDRFERTLVASQLLTSVSTYHDVAADGTTTTAGPPCP